MNRIRETFDALHEKRDSSKQLYSMVNEFHRENNKKRIALFKKEMTEQEYKLWRKQQIEDLKLTYSYFLKNQLDQANKMLEESQKQYKEQRSKDSNILSYQRKLDRISSLNENELNDLVMKYIGNKNYLFDEDEYYLVKNRINGSNIADRFKDLFYQKVKEKNNEEMWRYENDLGRKGNEVEKEYRNEYLGFNGKTAKVKNDKGELEDIFFKDLLEDEDISTEIEDFKNEIREMSFDYENK